MDATEKLLRENIKAAKEQQFSWCVSLLAQEERSPEAIKIVADLAILITSYEHDLRLIKASRGLNASIVQQLVNNHYREHHNLDADDNFIEADE